MTRIAILDRADMDAEQARVYDTAKETSGIVGGPYYAYIRLPKVFEACQNLRGALASGLLSRREQQIINLVVARHWNARYPWFAQVRGALAAGIGQAVIDVINANKTPDLADARERTCFVVARELLANKGLSPETYATAEATMGLEHLVALVASTGSFSMTCMTANTFEIRRLPSRKLRFVGGAFFYCRPRFGFARRAFGSTPVPVLFARIAASPACRAAAAAAADFAPATRARPIKHSVCSGPDGSASHVCAAATLGRPVATPAASARPSSTIATGTSVLELIFTNPFAPITGRSPAKCVDQVGVTHLDWLGCGPQLIGDGGG